MDSGHANYDNFGYLVEGLDNPKESESEKWVCVSLLFLFVLLLPPFSPYLPQHDLTKYLISVNVLMDPISRGLPRCVWGAATAHVTTVLRRRMMLVWALATLHKWVTGTGWTDDRQKDALYCLCASWTRQGTGTIPSRIPSPSRPYLGASLY